MSIYMCSNTHYYGQTPILKATFCSNVRRETLGKGTNKDWISAEAAAYPSGMNRAIALAIEQAIQKPRDRGTLFENKVRGRWEIDQNGKMKQWNNQMINEDELEEDTKKSYRSTCMGTKIPCYL